MVVREVYEIVTDSLSSDSKNGFSRRVLFVNAMEVATVIPIERPRQCRIFDIETRSVCNPNTLLCSALHQSRSTRSYPRCRRAAWTDARDIGSGETSGVAER